MILNRSDKKPISPVGKWFGNSSAKPLDQLEQFNNALGTFVKHRSDEAGGASVFRCHPGLRTIALTDHASAEFFVNAPRIVLEREPAARFGGIAIRPFAVGKHLPTIVDAGPSHDLTLCMIERMMQQRQDLLEPAIDMVFEQFAKRWQTSPAVTLLNELQELSALIMWQWILGVTPDPQLIRLWQRDGLVMTADTSYGRLLAKQRANVISAETREASDALLHLARTAPAYRAWVKLAVEHQYPTEQLGNFCVFLCNVNSIALGRSLFPTMLMVAQRPELRQALKACPFGFDQVDKEPYLEAMMVEATRLYTRPRFAVKIAQCDFSLPSSSGEHYAILKGERLMVILPVLHRDPARFVQPEHFDPSRYIDDPQLAQHVFGYMKSSARQNPYGCAAIGSNRYGPIMWKVLLQRLVSQATWKVSTEPEFSVDQQFDVGPMDLKMTDFQIV